jgi:hypothetical protein
MGAFHPLPLSPTNLLLNDALMEDRLAAAVAGRREAVGSDLLALI